VGELRTQNSLFMFINVQSWILDGSWCCLCTNVERKTRSRRGPLKISLTSPLFHRSGTKAGFSSDWGRAAVAAWVASAREGLERRTRDCRNMEGRGDGASDIRPSHPLIGQEPINIQYFRFPSAGCAACIYYRNVVLRKEMRPVA
jgi:hypothetical protein